MVRLTSDLADLVRPAAGTRRRSAVIIGAGFGGLAAAVRLAAHGFKVTVVDKLDAPGGRAYVHRRDGFVFDAGPTIITAPFLFEELWQLCGKRLSDDVTLRPISPFYRIRFDDGEVFNYSGDPDAMRSEVARLSPSDLEGYKEFMRASEAIFKIGFEKFGGIPFSSWTDMARIVPAMIALASYKTAHGLVASYIRDPRLRTVFSFHPLLIGGNPFTTTSIYCLIAFLERKWGVHFAMGGTGQLIQGLVGLIEGQGGQVRCGEEVISIIVKDGTAKGVRLASGENIYADMVVSNADAAWTYRYLLPQQARRRWTDRRIDRARYSMGLFVWYFGTKRQYEDVAHHTILLGPRYRELLEDIFERKILSDDFSLYLHRPTATDPSLAPPGNDAFYALSPVPHLGGGIDWETKAEPYRRAIARRLSETLLPDLEANIATSFVTTPQDFESRLLSFNGAAFGLEPVLTQSAWFRPHNKSEDVKNLFLVGAGTHPGAGVPGVLLSARVLEKVIADAHAFA
jgi:phytoene desaturase